MLVKSPIPLQYSSHKESFLAPHWRVQANQLVNKVMMKIESVVCSPALFGTVLNNRHDYMGQQTVCSTGLNTRTVSEF